MDNEQRIRELESQLQAQKIKELEEKVNKKEQKNGDKVCCIVGFSLSTALCLLAFVVLGFLPVTMGYTSWVVSGIGVLLSIVGIVLAANIRKQQTAIPIIIIVLTAVLIFCNTWNLLICLPLTLTGSIIALNRRNK